MALACLSLYQTTGKRAYYKYGYKLLKKVRFPSPRKKTSSIPSTEQFSYLLPMYRLFEVTRSTKIHTQLHYGYHSLKTLPKSESGLFYENGQVRLETLYNTLVGYCACQKLFTQHSDLYEVINQITLTRKLLLNQENGLYHSAIDETKKAKWANPNTGISPVFDVQETGFLLLTFIEILSIVPKQLFEPYQKMVVLFKESVKNLLPYLSQESKLFYCFIPDVSKPNNFPETTGSAMIAYVLIKGCKLGLLHHEKYYKIAVDIIQTILSKRLVETNSCVVLTGSGRRDPLHTYLLADSDVESVSNDPLGVAALALAVCELKRYQQNQEAKI